MKLNLVYIFFTGCVLIILVAGCIKHPLDSEPTGSYTTANYWRNQNDVIAGVNGIYNVLTQEEGVGRPRGERGAAVLTGRCSGATRGRRAQLPPFALQRLDGCDLQAHLLHRRIVITVTIAQFLDERLYLHQVAGHGHLSTPRQGQPRSCVRVP